MREKADLPRRVEVCAALHHSGFFVLRMAKDRRQDENQPHAIGLGNGRPMSFAGLWEEWTPKDGSPLLSVTMITTEPNSVMEPTHNRMPVIIGDKNLGKWLGEEPAAPNELRRMLKPFAPERMSAWKVASAVGQVRNQGPELVGALP